jgi:arabinofuranosyltransferase
MRTTISKQSDIPLRSDAFAPGVPLWLPPLTATLLALVVLAYFLQNKLAITGGQWGVPLDDAWIHYQFARNISQGFGFSYNPGEPMPGSTAPLWTLLLAGVGLMTDDFLIPSLLLSAGFLLVTVWLTYGFTYWLTRNLFVATVAALVLLLSGRFLWAGLAGMETTAFAALSLAAVWSYSRQGLRPWPAFLFALASQMRPEGHALFVLAVADSAVTWWRQTAVAGAAKNPEQSAVVEKWPFIGALLVYTIIGLPYMLFSLSVTGHPLSNTFYAKAGSQHFFSWRALRETMALHWQDNALVLLLLPFGIWPLVRRGRLVAAWLFGLLLLTPIVVDLIWHHGRYTIPLIPFQIVVAAVGLHWLGARWPQRRLVLAPTLTLLLILAGLWHLPHWARMLGHNANEILQVDVAMGHWLAANTPADALIAVDDIGAIVFISQRRVLDLNGLVSPEMWPVIRGEAAGRPRNEATARLLSQLQPDYLAVFPVWHWEIATNAQVAEPLARFVSDTKTIIGEQEAIVYRARWPYQSGAAPEFSHQATFGDAFRLLGYDLALPAHEAEPLAVTFYWQSLASVAVGYDVFVHVLDDQGQIVAQSDSEPVYMLAPTRRWQPGDVVRDTHPLVLPAELAPGTYHIQAGMFERNTGARLTAVAGEVRDNAVYLTSFEWHQTLPGQ